MINLPKRTAKDKTKCTDCGVKLTKKTQRTYNGIIYGQCKECIKNKVKKHNEKRKKALKDSKWF